MPTLDGLSAIARRRDRRGCQGAGVMCFVGWTLPAGLVTELRTMFALHTLTLRRAVLLATAAAALAALPAFAQKGSQFRMMQDDFPFQAACIGVNVPTNNVAYKGYAIRVGNDATVLWDTDTLRLVAGWTGGFVDTRGVVFDGDHGKHPQMIGDQKFAVGFGPGVAGASGSYADTRPEPYGPIDKSVAHWQGLHVSGMNVLLNYTVNGNTLVSEQPGSVPAEGGVAFTRTIKVEPPSSGFLFFKSRKTTAPFSVALADVSGNVQSSADRIVATADGKATVIAAADLPKGVSLAAENGRVSLKFAKGAKGGTLKVAIWNGAESAVANLAGLAAKAPALADFAKGGPRRWTETVKLQGKLNTSATPDGAYATDSITAPEDNPWKRRVRFGGMDFFADGKRAALCTHDGDIWIVSGIDEKLANLEWSRFASGLYEPLGLQIVDGQIYVSGREGITRFADLNNDGEADYYEAFNHDIMSTRGFHEFVFDLQRDAAGNFYYAKANPVNAGGGGFGNEKASRGNGQVCSHAGCLFKVSPDGKKFEVVGRGFRAPNGIGVRADGQITTGDNEGTWVPSSPINWLDGKTFHGVINKLTPKEVADAYAPPIMWLSHADYCNSNGGQTWVPNDKWGPFQGELLYESYGKSSLYLVMRQDISNGRQQAAAVKFPLKFTSSVMRARWHPVDGQLYIAGLSEWQSNAAKITGFDRVRYTGKPVYSVRAVKVVKDGVQVSFTQPLDKASAEDVQNWSGKRWNYIRSENYGSPEVNIADPKKKGREAIDITAAKLSDDGKTVTLKIADLKLANQQSLKWDLKAKDGTPVAQDIQHTIHEIPSGNALN
jgi:hypothetical protein